MNTKHYPSGAPGGKGGQFAPSNSGNSGGVSASANNHNQLKSAISVLPKVKSSGEKRVFFEDLSSSEQKHIYDDFYSKYGAIYDAINKIAANYKTSWDRSPQREYLKQKWIEEEYQKQLNAYPKKKERKATILLGLPGSGKSTISEPLIKEEGAFEVDCDIFKEYIPEFIKDSNYSASCHNESVWLSNQLRHRLIKEGYNMIIPKVGACFGGAIENTLRELNDNGYKTEVILLDVPFDISLARTEERYEKSPKFKRLIPLSKILLAEKNIPEVFDRVLKSPGVVGGKIYSNDVKLGEKPILLYKYLK